MDKRIPEMFLETSLRWSSFRDSIGPKEPRHLHFQEGPSPREFWVPFWGTLNNTCNFVFHTEPGIAKRKRKKEKKMQGHCCRLKRDDSRITYLFLCNKFLQTYWFKITSIISVSVCQESWLRYPQKAAVKVRAAVSSYGRQNNLLWSSFT